MEEIEARKALFSRHKELSDQRHVYFTEIKAINEELAVIGDAKSASRMKPEELEEKIRQAEMKIECESMSMKEEKEARRRIQAMEDELRNVKSSAGVVEKRSKLMERKKEIKALLDATKTEFETLHAQIGETKKEQQERKKEQQERKEKEKEEDSPLKKLDKEWEENKKAIDDLYAKRKQIRDEYFAAERMHKNYSFENKRRMACQRALDRKLEEEAELEEERKLEEEALKRHPFEKEMAECDTVTAYLKSLLPQEKKTAAKAVDIKVPEGMTLLKKQEEEYFSVAGGKKNKKERRAAKKADIVHNFTSLESFATIRVKAPKTVEEVEEVMKVVAARKEFFNALPRGADIDAELAKLN